jgi:adenosylhomocysteine nucleosidase
VGDVTFFTSGILSDMKICVYLLLFTLASGAHAQRRSGVIPHYDATPRLGIVIPRLPADYALLRDALKDSAHVQDGAFDFETGTIAGTPVVMVVQPAPGEVLRALESTAMIHDFNLRLLFYAGTSGGHLPKGQMAPGDIVLGAKNVDHGSYHVAPDGRMEGGVYEAMNPGAAYTSPFYADPALLSMLACSASRVATATTLPPWVAPIRADAHPQVFYFGIQGSSTVWSDSKAYIEASMAVFHEIDEDGDWYSNLAASLYNIPFLEVSVISNSIFAFPDALHGTPAHPESEADSHVIAQRISNRVLLDLIGRNGKQLLTGTYASSTQSPFPASDFETPLDPQRLLSGCKR